MDPTRAGGVAGGVPQHLPILRAMDQEPVDEDRLMGWQLQTLHRRLGLPQEAIEELVVQLHDLRLVGLTRDSLHTMMTAMAAEDLRRWITPLGRRLMDHLRTAPSLSRDSDRQIHDGSGVLRSPATT